MTARFWMSLKLCAFLICFLSPYLTRTNLQFGTWTHTHLSDTIDTVLQHQVGRSKDLSAPTRNSLSPCQSVCQSSYSNVHLYCNVAQATNTHMPQNWHSHTLPYTLWQCGDAKSAGAAVCNLSAISTFSYSQM
jgi:hypothetical protein